ncbi:hypothetical protein [Streptomyces siamensis]|uniref:hypothetical protein n=1 Tax=Streptomyces siamensis TaxID=1274986 RepID=UPI0031E5A331
MSEAWAAIIAAVAAGVFGIAGILTGIVAGRRQTVDQATVEHGQWLRGQGNRPPAPNSSTPGTTSLPS